jgi:uncharacterized membrane protein YbhN (UPF0104 family)
VVLAGLAVHVLVPLIAPLERSLAVARTLPWLPVLGAASAQVLSYVGSGYIVHSALRLVGVRASVARGVATTMGASSVDLLGGGTLSFGAAAQRWTRAAGAEGALLAGWLPPYLNGLVQLVLGGLGVLYLIAARELSSTLTMSLTILAVLLGLVIAAFWAAVKHPSEAVSLLIPVGRSWARVRRRTFDPGRPAHVVGILRTCAVALGNGGWRRPFLGSLLNILADLACLVLLFVAAGSVPEVGVLLAGWAVPQFLGRLSFLPGGIGVVEGGMVAFYESLGVPSEVSVVVILLYRALSFWLPSAAGIPIAIYLEREAGYAASHGSPGRPK